VKTATIFLMPFILGAAIVLLLVSVIVSFVGLVRAFAKNVENGVGAIMPLIINLIAVIIIIFSVVMPQDYKASDKFEKNFDKMNDVVSQIVEGTLGKDGEYVISLPRELNELSDGGYISLSSFGEQTAIYFYTDTGLLEVSEGYVFFTDELDSELYPEQEFVIKEDMGGGWYYCSTQ
jgi:hypothetical protein